METIQLLMQVCSPMERSLVEKMICSAAEYLLAVTVMETTRRNVAGYHDEQWKAQRESTDRARTAAHDSFISMVNIVNRICSKYGLLPVYRGDEARRAYGDFALEVVTEIFTKRV